MFGGTPFTLTTTIRDDLVRVRLNYKVGG